MPHRVTALVIVVVPGTKAVSEFVGKHVQHRGLHKPVSRHSRIDHPGIPKVLLLWQVNVGRSQLALQLAASVRVGAVAKVPQGVRILVVVSLSTDSAYRRLNGHPAIFSNLEESWRTLIQAMP